MIDAVLSDAVAPLLVSAVIGGVGWVSWVSRKVQEVLTTLKSIGKSIEQIPELVLALEDHRREDAEAFARLDERVRILENVPRERMRIV